MRIISILFSMLLGLTLTFSANTANASETQSFSLDFGPWHRSMTGEAHVRSIDLILMGKIINVCTETLQGGKSNILQQCPFVHLDETGRIVVNQLHAMKALYHDSGMNLDGSKRRFYHEWFGIE